MCIYIFFWKHPLGFKYDSTFNQIPRLELLHCLFLQLVLNILHFQVTPSILKSQLPYN